jgi:hypothetical protein
MLAIRRRSTRNLTLGACRSISTSTQSGPFALTSCNYSASDAKPLQQPRRGIHKLILLSKLVLRFQMPVGNSSSYKQSMDGSSLTANWRVEVQQLWIR